MKKSIIFSGFLFFFVFFTFSQVISAKKNETVQPEIRDSSTLPTHPKKFSVDWSGMIITGYRWTDNDSSLLRLGDSDGFYVRRARLQLKASYWYFSGVVTIDGAFDRSMETDSLSPATRQLFVELRDAYFEYKSHFGLQVQIGQTKTPFGYSFHRSAAEEHFSMFSLIESGEDLSFGYQAPRIFPGRDIGLLLSYLKELGRFQMQIHGMVFNGNGANRLGNDSDMPAFAGRLFLKYSDIFSFGASALYNARMTGEQPRLYSENDLAFQADLRLTIAGFFMEVEGAYQTTSYPTLNQAPIVRLGGRADVGYRFKKIGIEPVFRFQYYDPSSLFEDDHLLYFTVGVNWFWTFEERHSIGVRLSYTHKMEAETRKLNNDQVFVEFQYSY